MNFSKYISPICVARRPVEECGPPQYLFPLKHSVPNADLLELSVLCS